VLYHGTSTLCLESVRREFRLSVWGRAGSMTKGTGNKPARYRSPTAPAFPPGMIAHFKKYPRGESGMFSPGEEIFIHSTELGDHPRYKGRRIIGYICTKASDAEAAAADPYLDRVLAEELYYDQLRRDLKVALTTDRSVAEYWACVGATNDKPNNPNVESHGVVLALNAEHLVERGYDLREVQLENRPDWQNEIACWDDIPLLNSILIEEEPVTPERAVSRAISRIRLPCRCNTRISNATSPPTIRPPPIARGPAYRVGQISVGDLGQNYSGVNNQTCPPARTSDENYETSSRGIFFAQPSRVGDRRARQPKTGPARLIRRQCAALGPI
jgi:hypothetical protein